MCSLIDILQWKKNQKDSNDFWRRKLTLKVKFWYCLKAPHYSNFQNLVISFEYSWFLAKNLSNFVSLPWKLHNRECHNCTWTCLMYNWIKYRTKGCSGQLGLSILFPHVFLIFESAINTITINSQLKNEENE